jgi:ribosome-associated toxin RatA of RatAB toxin-antitoxin module
MHANQSIDMAAPAAAIYALAQDVASWPRLLPHYRYVRVLRETSDERIAVMAARRSWIPVRWIARERLHPNIPRIEFTHLSGWTAGMEVAWTFEPTPHGTRVTIEHDLRTLRRAIIRTRLARTIIARFFIQPIASRTLARMKALAERPVLKPERVT